MNVDDKLKLLQRGPHPVVARLVQAVGAREGRPGDTGKPHVLDGLKLLDRGVNVVKTDRRHGGPALGREGPEIDKPPVVRPVSGTELVICRCLDLQRGGMSRRAHQEGSRELLEEDLGRNPFTVQFGSAPLRIPHGVQPARIRDLFLPLGRRVGVEPVGDVRRIGGHHAILGVVDEECLEVL